MMLSAMMLSMVRDVPEVNRKGATAKRIARMIHGAILPSALMSRVSRTGRSA